ncbi:MAG: insulinase family protein, partial [Betaproteobacteria bacterium]
MPPTRFARSLLRFAFLAMAALSLQPALAAGPQKVTTVEGVTEYRLDNGLRVLLVPDGSIDSVMVNITYFVGSRNEGYGEKGMAHLLEHMLFKGTTKHPKLKEEFSSRGVRFNGSTSYDRTNYYETLAATPANLEWALGVEADRMLNAFVRKSDLDSEMTVVRNEFESGENNPGRVLRQRMLQIAFPWHNYGNSVIGARSDIENVPIERLRAFYRTYYQPDNAMLIIAGKFDEQQALGMAAKHFGPLPRPARKLPEMYTTEPTQDGERSVVLRRAGDSQMLGSLYRVPSGGHEDYPAIDVLVHLLATQPTGRLHRALVQKGLATSIWGGESSLRDPGFMYFGAGMPKGAATEPVRDALLATLENLAAEPVREEEVERAKTALLNDFEKTQTDTLALVPTLGEFGATGDWRLFYLYRDRLRKVTAADVQRVATAYLKPANRVLGAFVPTDRPDRAEIPPTPDLARALAGYAGGKAPELGDAFDPSPANIESRVIRKTLSNGIRVALLPKKTRGGNVIARLALHWGDEASKANRSTSCALAGAMLMRGTRKHTRAELQEAFEKLKANVSINGEGAGIDTQREHLAGALRLAAEVLKEPVFPPSEFAELRQATITGAESRRGDPTAM